MTAKKTVAGFKLCASESEDMPGDSPR